MKISQFPDLNVIHMACFKFGRFKLKVAPPTVILGIDDIVRSIPFYLSGIPELKCCNFLKNCLPLKLKKPVILEYDPPTDLL